MRERTVCYLCGERFVSTDERSVDHVPPKVIFPKELRRHRNFSGFWTAPAHKACNNGYSLDEQYFVHSLGLLCNGSPTGHFVAEKILIAAERGEDLSLHRRIHDEFHVDAQTGTLRKTFNHDRVNRIAHKIVRGLWFIRAGCQEILPAEWRADFALYDRNNAPPIILEEGMARMNQWGDYPDVFFFKQNTFPDGPAHFFALVFWEWLLITVTIHEPECACSQCQAA